MTGRSPQLIGAIVAVMRDAGPDRRAMSEIVSAVGPRIPGGVSAAVVHAGVRHLMSIGDVEMVALPAEGSWVYGLCGEGVRGKPWHGLSRREREVAAMLVEGVERGEIANTLKISRQTVDTHRLRVLDKLAVANVVYLTHLAIARGWVEVGERVSGWRGRVSIGERA